MTLSPGMRVGPYEIVARLGAGGMGEVYRARDTRLGRDVAIKVLSPQLASSPSSHERFAREARTVAGLGHPHICPVFDVGEHEGRRYMVMQRLDGETLASVLERGPLPLDTILEYAVQLADALEAAHRAGVIHRDIKPGNVMVTRNGVVLLDFGLAKLDSEDVELASSRGDTQSAQLTEPGVLLGTPLYMAPEQLDGRPADARTDIFALGVVLYEMLTSRPPFGESSRAQLMAAILREQPRPPSTIRADVPRAVDRLVLKCLEKDPDRRWTSAGSIADVISWAREAPEVTLTGRTRRSRPGLRGWAIAAVLIVAAAAVTWWLTRPAPVALEPMEFEVVLPRGAAITSIDSGLTLSPDGRTLVYSAALDGARQLFRRRLNSVESVPLTGTTGGADPVFSPDGQWIAFTGPRGLSRVSVGGGAPIEFGVQGSPGAWNERDEIVVTRGGRSGLALLRSAGDLKPITTVGSEHGYTSHRNASFLPGGDTVLFTAGPPADAAWYEADILAQAAMGDRPQLLIKGAAQARYVAGGHLVYARAGTLYAVPFDAPAVRVTGQAMAVLEGVRESPSQGAAQFAVADSGHLAYVPGGLVTSEVLWIDRSGRLDALMTNPPRDQVYQPRLSPDGRYLALIVARGNDEIWVYDMRDHVLERLASGANFGMPEWTHDSQRVSFSQAGAPMSWRRADRSDAVTWFADVGGSPAGWSPDGRALIYYGQGPNTGTDVFLFERESRRVRPVLDSVHQERSPALSPDGRWLAFSSDESGRFEIYVQAFPSSRGRVRVSRGGGTEPRWARHGGELFFRQGNTMMAARRESDERFAPPVALFTLPSWVATPGGSRANYDVDAAGRFVIVRSNEAADVGTRIRIVLNWTEQLKRLVASGS
jgi:serine/threonine-protein kinase